MARAGRALLARHVGGQRVEQGGQAVEVGVGEPVAESPVEGGRRFGQPDKGRLARRGQFHHMDRAGWPDPGSW